MGKEEGRKGYGVERREEVLWVGYREGKGGVMSNRQEQMSRGILLGLRIFFPN